MQDAGTYDVEVQASLVDWPDVAEASFTFRLVMIDPCVSTHLIKQSLPDMSVTVGEPDVTQTFSQIKDEVAINYGIENLCGKRKYVLNAGGSPLILKEASNQ